MITFKQYLTEARIAPLYHGTAAYFLADIVIGGIKPFTTQTNKRIKIRPNNTIISLSDATQDVGILTGVSLSRNFNFSKRYGAGVVLELDQQKLSQNYRIVPFNFWAHTDKARNMGIPGGENRRNEYEEFVITRKPIPFSYVKRVFIDPAYTSKGFPIIEELRKKHGATFVREMRV